MKGSIRERSPGRWAIIIDDPNSSTRKRRWHSFKGTKRQAQIECARLISEMQNGSYLAPDKTTFAEFAERWLTHVKSQVSPKSHERYREIMRKNVVPLIGAVVLTKLKPAIISEAYAKALESGRRDGSGGLSPRTVRHMHRRFPAIARPGRKMGTLNPQPCRRRRPAAGRADRMHTYDPAADRRAYRCHARHPAFRADTARGVLGMRRGEIAALRWKNVDLDAGQLAVVESAEQIGTKVSSRPPKNGNGRTRTVRSSSRGIARPSRRRPRSS